MCILQGMYGFEDLKRVSFLLLFLKRLFGLVNFYAHFDDFIKLVGTFRSKLWLANLYNDKKFFIS